MLTGGVGDTRSEHCRAVLAVHPRDGVGLANVQVRVVERRDRARVVEERVPVRDRGREAELVADVLVRIAVVVDLELVQDAVVELREVRPARRLLERDVVRDQRDRVRPVRTPERVQIGVVRRRVVGDHRRFAVTRRCRLLRARRAGEAEGGECCRNERGECDSPLHPLLLSISRNPGLVRRLR